VNSFDPKVGSLFDGLGGIFRNKSGLSKGFGGGNLDRKPGSEAVFIAPDAGHHGAAIARDHSLGSLM
jgi:hypothetical protein